MKTVLQPDKGGVGWNRGGSAGAAGSEWPPSEVKGRLSHQVFGAGSAEEGGSTTERTREGLLPVEHPHKH